MAMKQIIEDLKRQNRDLSEELKVLDIKYANISDLVNDAACRIKDKEPIDKYILDAFVAHAKTTHCGADE